MTALEPLLRKWSEAEPERCRYESGASVFAKVQHLGKTWLVYGDRCDDAHRIQAAVQEACTANGWGWSLNYYPDRNQYNALVDAGRESQWSGFVDDPAVGILSAYLGVWAAVEADDVKSA
jgi:hypothetical protein